MIIHLTHQLNTDEYQSTEYANIEANTDVQHTITINRPAKSKWRDLLGFVQISVTDNGNSVSISGCLTDQQVSFPVDFQETFSRKFSRICSFIDIYRAGSLTPGMTLILFTQAIAQLKDIYWELIAPISINPGLLQDVFTGTL